MRSDENFDASTSGPPSYCPQGVNTVKMILVTAWACARIRGTLETRRKYQDLWDANIGAHRQMLAKGDVQQRPQKEVRKGASSFKRRRHQGMGSDHGATGSYWQ
jgi:hypothetical protein